MWIIIALQGVVFLIWAIEAFRILFHVAGRAQTETGRFVAGPIAFLRALRSWWSDPDRLRQRMRFIALTILTMGLSVAMAIVSNQA